MLAGDWGPTMIMPFEIHSTSERLGLAPAHTFSPWRNANPSVCGTSAIVGNEEGAVVGKVDGAVVGDFEGELDGALVGLSDGELDGRADGRREGLAEGAVEG